jgi:hypothetical protein
LVWVLIKCLGEWVSDFSIHGLPVARGIAIAAVLVASSRAWIGAPFHRTVGLPFDRVAGTRRGHNELHRLQ